MHDSDQETVYLKDIAEGETRACGSATVSAEDITDFGDQFDPLPIHTDPSAASDSRYGGLIASGYHTLSLSVRLLVEEVRSDRAVVAGLGIDDVQWHKPVRPGDTISVTTTVVETRTSESNPEAGVLHELISVTNQNGSEVLSFENYELIERRST